MNGVLEFLDRNVVAAVATYIEVIEKKILAIVSLYSSESLTTAEQSQPPTRTFIAVSLLLATKTNLPAYESLGSTFALGGVRIV